MSFIKLYFKKNTTNIQDLLKNIWELNMMKNILLKCKKILYGGGGIMHRKLNEYRSILFYVKLLEKF